MFVQVIQGHVSDADRLHAAFDRWNRDLSPGAVGWLGSTGGVTDDGDFVALARFESEDAANRNSARPEQDRWWSDTSKLFDGKVTFHNCANVNLDVDAEPERAGFVQVMQGHGTDPDRAWELMTTDADSWASFRPDILGTVAAAEPNGDYTVAVYFNSEDEARAGERKEPPPELAAQMAEMNRVIGEPRYLDLHHPWINTHH